MTQCGGLLVCPIGSELRVHEIDHRVADGRLVDTVEDVIGFKPNNRSSVPRHLVQRFGPRPEYELVVRRVDEQQRAWGDARDVVNRIAGSRRTLRDSLGQLFRINAAEVSTSDE